MARKKKPPTTTRDPSTWAHPEDRVDTIQLGGRTLPRCRAALSSRKWPDGADKRCSKPRKRDYYVCITHGSKGDTGHSVKHGNRSFRHLGPLQEAVDRLREDQAVLDDTPGLRVLHAWAEHLFELAGEGDGTGFRTGAMARYTALEAAVRQADQEAAATALASLGKFLREGAKKLKAREKAVAAVERAQTHKTRALEVRHRAQSVVNGDTLAAVLGQFVMVMRGGLSLHKCEECGHLDRSLFPKMARMIRDQCVDPAGRFTLLEPEVVDDEEAG